MRSIKRVTYNAQTNEKILEDVPNAVDSNCTILPTLEEIIANLNNTLENKANKKNNIVYVTDIITENPTAPIADTINQLFIKNKTNGIKIILDTNITIKSTIYMQNNCTLEGSTKRSQIRLGDGANCDMINWNYANLALLRNIWLRGNKYGNATGSALVCGGDVGAIDKSADGSSVENVDITECAEDGLKVLYPIWVIRFSGIRIGQCAGYGFYNTSTDNIFENIYIQDCGNTENKSVGMWFGGANNKLINAKVVFSGLANVGNSWGIKLSGFRQQIVNLEAQDNRRNGILIEGMQNSNVSVLSDGNVDKVPHVAGNGVGVRLTGCNHNIFSILTENYTYSSGYYHDVDLDIKANNSNNNISFMYNPSQVNIALANASVPSDRNFVNGQIL